MPSLQQASVPSIVMLFSEMVLKEMLDVPKMPSLTEPRARTVRVLFTITNPVTLLFRLIGLLLPNVAFVVMLLPLIVKLVILYLTKIPSLLPLVPKVWIELLIIW